MYLHGVNEVITFYHQTSYPHARLIKTSQRTVQFLVIKCLRILHHFDPDISNHNPKMTLFWGLAFFRAILGEQSVQWAFPDRLCWTSQRSLTLVAILSFLKFSATIDFLFLLCLPLGVFLSSILFLLNILALGMPSMLITC